MRSLTLLHTITPGGVPDPSAEPHQTLVSITFVNYSENHYPLIAKPSAHLISITSPKVQWGTAL